MLGLFKNLVTKLGGIDTSHRNHVDTFTEERILEVKGEKIAKSNYGGGIWIQFQELSDYVYLNVSVVNQTKIKTNKGCNLTFYGGETEILKLESDTKEIESVFSNVSNRWITEISFDVTQVNFNFLENKTATTVKLTYKKTTEIFESI